MPVSSSALNRELSCVSHLCVSEFLKWPTCLAESLSWLTALETSAYDQLLSGCEKWKHGDGNMGERNLIISCWARERKRLESLNILQGLSLMRYHLLALLLFPDVSELQLCL